MPFQVKVVVNEMLKKFPKGHKCPQCGSIRNIMVCLGRSNSISLSYLELRRFVTQNLYISIITYYKWLAFKWSKDGKNMRSNLWKPPLHNPTVIVVEAKFYILNHIFFGSWVFSQEGHFFGPILSKNVKRPSELKVASKNNANTTKDFFRTCTVLPFT